MNSRHSLLNRETLVQIEYKDKKRFFSNTRGLGEEPIFLRSSQEALPSPRSIG